MSVFPAAGKTLTRSQNYFDAVAVGVAGPDGVADGFPAGVAVGETGAVAEPEGFGVAVTAAGGGE